MSDDAPEPPQPRRLTITNVKGLHARASAKFASLAERYDASISVSKDDFIVPGTSIMGLLLLAASQGSEIAVTATGPQAQEALDALTDLVKDGFGERD